MSTFLKSIFVIAVAFSVVALGANEFYIKHKKVERYVDQSDVDSLLNKVQFQTALERASLDPKAYEEMMNNKTSSSSSISGNIIIDKMKRAKLWLESYFDKLKVSNSKNTKE